MDAHSENPITIMHTQIDLLDLLGHCHHPQKNHVKKISMINEISRDQ